MNYLTDKMSLNSAISQSLKTVITTKKTKNTLEISDFHAEEQKGSTKAKQNQKESYISCL